MSGGGVVFATTIKMGLYEVAKREQESSRVLYMSFDRFLLAVESRDLSQVDKSIKRVSSFPKLSDG